ncbi:MAG: squalene/phytoene synthase family protein [Verrucomicrobiales bacterium]|nr:squalene/phytoene synthase family protein [Verrucomicrobiales bacterium]
MSAPGTDLLTSLLRDVSRSFYSTLRILPAPVRPQIGLAYLLARATDTIADTEVLPLDQRLDALERLRLRILGASAEPVDFAGIAANQALPAERELLGRVEEAIGVLSTFPCFDRCCIREVVETITGGQELDLRRFHAARVDHVVPLATEADLDDYTYRVAGCVGGFWTRICRSHLYPTATLDLPTYLENAVRFGKGLQLVNILRDLPADLARGRCYIPAEGLAREGLRPADLGVPAHMERFRALYRRHLETAVAHLEAGWKYTCSTPRAQTRVRLACALPILIGIETLRLLDRGNVLDGSRRIKVSRRQVRGILAKTLLRHPFPRGWVTLFSPLFA